MRNSLYGGMTILAVAAVFCVAGCSKTPATNTEGASKAVAYMHPTEKNKATGFVSFTREGNGVRVVAQLQGATPGPHGFHVHEYGDCTSPDANSAGGHFNPTGQQHGAPADVKRHVGDLGNIEVDASGAGKYEILDKSIKLDGPQSIIGRSVVVHAGPDDFKSQPTGGSGNRVACGVIGIAK